MTMHDYTYALLRYVPDPERMEPLNFGVVVQGPEGDPKLKLNNRFGQSGKVDRKVYKQWRDFLTEEVEGDQKSIFRPSRSSPDFWMYLRSLTGDTVIMTPPLRMSTSNERTVEDVLEQLYSRLVSQKDIDKKQSRGRPGHPAFEFRRIRKEKDFDGKGLKKHHALKSAGNDYLWAPHRVAENGKILAIDKIEVDTSPERTYVEIDKARSAATNIASIKDKNVRWIVLIDPLEDDAFKMTASDREDMNRAFDATKKCVGRAKGEIISTTEEVGQLASELELLLATTE